MKKLTLTIVTIVTIAMLMLSITAIIAIAEETGETIAEDVIITDEAESLSYYDQFRQYMGTEDFTDLGVKIATAGIGLLFFIMKKNSKTNQLLSASLDTGTVGLKEALGKILGFENRVEKLEGQNIDLKKELQNTKELLLVSIDKSDSIATALSLVYSSMINNEELRTSVITTLDRGLSLLTAPKKQLVAEQLKKINDKYTEAKTESDNVAEEINKIIGG